MNQRSCLTRILNLCWHLGFGSCHCTGNCSIVPPAAVQAQHLRELVVALAWWRLSVRKTRSKEERGSIMTEHRTPKDRGGFTQWFGSCSLINTLYVWFPASWAPIVAGQLFERSSKSDDLYSNIQHGQPARGLSQNPSRGHAWHQPTQEFAGPSVPATEAENNEVM